MEFQPHGSKLRMGRASIAGQPYHVITSTLGRTPIFGELTAARTLINVIKGHDNRGYTQTLAFVVMPDHLHWLFSLGQRQGLSRTVGGLKAISAKRLGGRIWQDGFFDHAVRTEENLKKIARYIVANPLRAGLVEEIGDYAHWDAMWL
ncbi:REP-associated tyrosine transposase [Thiohalomonas denitrificans]|uniref:REP element-mobilizing transposase RayT n=1 Tax=Thiohalomonas denitrificans TaxID=415747 RepID=A0A1G5QTS3_9GAMM|nr:transposase [Thiohalomonas denitrificans]SCZ65255.1 REP element-mobilizing transposase RayT [Thiohalomonas denitrificans]